jgi:hypothetical protein
MENVKFFDGKKFMWDGKEYPDEKTAQEIALKYKNDGFETEVINESNKYFIFSRKVVKEVIIEETPV